MVAKVLLSHRNQKIDWGIDLSQNEIDFAKKSGSYINCKVADVCNLPFENKSFNVVFSNSVVEHLPDLELSLSEMSRVLKKKQRLARLSSSCVHAVVQVCLINATSEDKWFLYYHYEPLNFVLQKDHFDRA